MADPLGELREKLRQLEKENERLSAFMDDIAELHRRIVQPIIEAESRAIVEYERRDRGDEEPYGLSVMDTWRLRALRDEIAVAVASHRKRQDECAYAHEHAEMNVEWTWCPFCAARLPAPSITDDETSYPPRGPVR